MSDINMAERVQCLWCGHERAEDGGPSMHCTEGWRCAHSKPCQNCDAQPGHEHAASCPAGPGFHRPERAHG